MRNLAPDSLPLARIVIAEELLPGVTSDTEVQAAFRVCEKLRHSLSELVGTVGFRLLLTRAITLNRAEFPWLDKLGMKPDGTFASSAEVETGLTKQDASEGGTALVDQLLGLLTIFIVAALTQRLLSDSWPKSALTTPEARK